MVLLPSPRRLAALLAALAIFLFAVLPGASSPHSFRAEALVVARQISMPADEIPDLMAALFETPKLAELAVQEGRLPFDPEVLVPRHASMEIVSDTVVVRVVGHASDRRTAISTANVVARTFVDILNEAASGLGSFAVQNMATDAVMAQQTGRGIRGQPAQIRLVFALLVAGLWFNIALARSSVRISSQQTP